MLTSILQENLAVGLSIVGRAVGNKRSPIPVLSSVLLTVEGDHLTLRATDLELTITHSTPGVAGEDGSVCLPYTTLRDLVAASHDCAKLQAKSGLL